MSKLVIFKEDDKPTYVIENGVTYIIEDDEQPVSQHTLPNLGGFGLVLALGALTVYLMYLLAMWISNQLYLLATSIHAIVTPHSTIIRLASMIVFVAYLVYRTRSTQ